MQKAYNFKLSLIIPTYKQERTIQKDIKNIKHSLEDLGVKYEIIVVIDGRFDKTALKLKQLKFRNLKVVELITNQGKGYAVKMGVKEARGDVIGFLDAGMDIDPNGIEMLINHMIWYDADIIVGSKLHPVSQVDYPVYRRILSSGYRMMTRVLFGFKIRDTQAGIKLFKKRIAKDVFSRSLVKEFAFDVEVLALAYKLGYTKIYEAPIKLEMKRNSSIISPNFWKIISRMVLDTFGIYYRLNIRKYYKKNNKKNWIT